MKRSIAFVGCVMAALLVIPVGPALATWVGTNCTGTHVDDHYVKRSEAQAYSAAASGEGYEWGGGCWNNNDKDDTPGAPDSSGEGADCSGRDVHDKRDTAIHARNAHCATLLQ